jgi:flavin-dependent dehydrogenase
MACTPIDVAILGGGPAGCAAALTLLRHTTRSVCVVEGSSYDRPRIGESVSGGLRPLLAWLDAGALFTDPSIGIASLATQSTWGSRRIVTRDAFLGGQGEGRLLDRRRFDQSIAALVTQRGGDVMTTTWFRDVEPANDGWHLRLEGPGGARSVQARFVIDATGRRTSFARRVGERPLALDRLVAVAACLRTDDPDRQAPPSVFVEAVEDGWWYSAPLPEGRAMLAFMTDADLLAASRMATRERFVAAWRATSDTHRRLAGHAFESGPRVHLANSQVLANPSGRRWVAAGDAALAHDPLSSAGIGHALASGIESARIAHRHLDGPDMPDPRYAGDVSRHLRDYLTQRAAVYASEARWPGAPFWARRHASRDEGAPAQTTA